MNLEALPDNLLRLIMSHLDVQTLGRVETYSKGWGAWVAPIYQLRALQGGAGEGAGPPTCGVGHRRQAAGRARVYWVPQTGDHAVLPGNLGHARPPTFQHGGSGPRHTHTGFIIEKPPSCEVAGQGVWRWVRTPSRPLASMPSYKHVEWHSRKVTNEAKLTQSPMPGWISASSSFKGSTRS